MIEVRATHGTFLRPAPGVLDDAGGRRTGRHGELGVVSVEDGVAHCVAEDVDHLAQLAGTRTVAGR